MAGMMRASRPGWVLEGLALIALVVVAFLAGMLVERLRSHAERDAMLRRYDQALREHRSLLMEAEKRQEGGAARR
jgi:membrane protein implicated in regulation of membrane protease activity